MNYIPHRGTIPAASLLALANSQGGRLSTAALLEAIGQPSDYSGLNSCLMKCVDNGLIEKERDLSLTFWRITEQGIAASLEVGPLGGHGDIVTSMPEQLKPIQRDAPAPDAESKRADAVLPQAAAPVAPSVAEPTTQELAEKLTDVVDATFVEVAISNTGRLLISNGQVQMALSPEQTEKVFEYLDAHRGIEWEGA